VKLETGTNGARSIGKLREIEYLVNLLHQANPASLAKLRQHLGKTEDEISSLLGVSPTTLFNWEIGTEIPSREQTIFWKVKLGSLVDKEVSIFLGTTNQKLIAYFCDIIWRLNLK
jgi:DNA-binding transcriptional regulator YiaG